jgi:GH25 family lysozyme M1 (1,4-beta-N-acetylmuramidase)
MDYPILASDHYSGNYLPGIFSPDRLAAMKDHGFQLGVFKASMGGGVDGRTVGGKWVDTPAIYCDLWRAAGLKAGLYHWADPTRPAPFQFDFFHWQIKRLAPDCVALDWEQNWANWTEYWEYIARTREGKDVRNCTPTKINSNADELDALIQPVADAYKIPFENYFYCHFPLTYGGGSYKLKKKDPPWLAIYPRIPAEHLVCETWAEFDQLLRDLVIGKSPLTQSAGVPIGVTTWRWWQFASTITLPGSAGKMDMSIFNGGQAEFNAWLNQPPPAPPVYFDQLPAAEKFDVLERHLRKAGDVDQDGEVRI